MENKNVKLHTKEKKGKFDTKNRKKKIYKKNEWINERNKRRK